MNWLRLVVVSTCLLSLLGCSISSQELRASPRDQATFDVDLPYRSVYANVAAAANRCFRGGTRASHFYAVESGLRPKQSTIEVVQGGVATRVMIATDIEETPKGAKVTYFVNRHFAIFTDFKPVIMGWATGTGSDCGVLN